MGEQNLKKNEMLTGIVLNLGCILLLNISSLILTQRFTQVMGLSMYGIYSVAYSVGNFLATSEFGVGIPVIRNTVLYRNAKDSVNEQQYLFVTRNIYFLLMLAITLICTGIYLFANRLFVHFDTEQIAAFRYMLIFSAANSLVMFLQNFYNSIILAYDRFSFTRICNIIKIILRTVLLFLLLIKGIEPYQIFLTDLVLNLIILVVFIVFCHKLGIRVRSHSNSSITFLSNVKAILFAYTMPIFESFNWTICPIMAGIFVSVQSVGLFNIGLVFCMVFTQISSALSQLRMGTISKLWLYPKDREALWGYVFWFGKIQAAVLGFILLGFVVAGPMFIQLWLGKEFSMSYLIALYVMLSLFIPLTQSTMEMTLFADNKYLGRNLIELARIVFTALMIPLLINFFGVVGIAYTIGAATIVFKFGAMNMLYRKNHLPILSFNKKVVLRILPSLIPAISAGLLITALNNTSLLIALLGTGTAVALYLVLTPFTFFSPYERKLLLHDLIGRFLKRKSGEAIE